MTEPDAPTNVEASSERSRDDGPEHPLFARLYDPVMKLPERLVFSDHRRELAEGLEGHVLDIGSGTGVMFPYFEACGGDLTVTAIEPDPHMRAQAREAATQFETEITVVDAPAEALPCEKNSVDAVTAGLVFCTIPDVAQALDEVARVLRPGGEFRFLEHVRGRWPIGIGHDMLTPCWSHAAGGCHLDRRTGDVFRQDDRFELLAFRRFESGVTRLLPLVRGRMQRRRKGWLLGD